MIETLIHLWSILSALGSIHPPPAKLVWSTIFSGKNDPSNPNPHLACIRVPGKKHHKILDDKTDMVVAHRTLPCRTRVLIHNPRTSRSTIAIVGDRMGYHRRKDGSFFSELDLAPAVARAVRSNGFEKMLIVALE